MRSAFKGKQPVTAFPKKLAAAQEGLFGKATYASDPYDDSSGTMKEYPLDKRKLGFYHRAPGRGMCAKTIDMERYRTHVRTEFKHIDDKLEATVAARAAASPKRGAAAAGGAGGAGDDGAVALTATSAAAGAAAATTAAVHTTFEREGRDVKEGMPTTLYDFVHSSDATRGDWQKTSRDVWYHRRHRAADERKVRAPGAAVSTRTNAHTITFPPSPTLPPTQPCVQRTGTMVPASDDIGYGIDGIEEAPAHGKKSAWRDFLDKGHREASLASF